MKTLKKILSVFCTVTLIALIFSICAVNSTAATVATSVTMSDFNRAPYTTFVKGVAVEPGTMNYMGGRLRQETVDGNSVAVYQFAKGNESDSGYNADGYGTRGDFKGEGAGNYGSVMLTSYSDGNFTPFTVKANTTYSVSFKYKVLSVDTENYNQGISVAMVSVKNMAGWSNRTVLSVFSTLKAVSAEWKTINAEFTTGTLTSGHTVMALGFNGYGEVMFDDITVNEKGAAEGGNNAETVTRSYTIDFTTGGYSATNCTGVGSKFLSRVTDPTDSSNTVLKLGSTGVGTYQGGRNIEIADGNGSATALITKPNSSYTVTVKYKLIGGSSNGGLQLHLGTQSAFANNLPKYKVSEVALPAATEDSATWLTATYNFKTTENQLYKDYSTSSSYTNVVNRIYLVRAGGEFDSYMYIDDVTVTETYTVPADQTRVWDFSSAAGWSAINGTLGNQVKHVTDPDDATNKVMQLSQNGYSFELAESSKSTSVPYTLLPSTSYTVSFKYKVAEGSKAGYISLYLGTQAAYSESLPKVQKKQTEHSAYVQGNGWKEVKITFTTTANQYYKEYITSSSYSNIVNKLYFVHATDGASIYIDDITVTNNNGTQPAPSVSEETTIERYVISSFEHTPYTGAVIGDAGNDWRVSKRMFRTKDGDNSVLGYSYDLDIQADLIKETNNGSGNRGSAMGTNGYTASCTNLVTTDGTAIKLKVGTAYRISYNYKVTEVGTDSYIGFCANRGKYQSGWTNNYALTNKGLYIFASEATVTDGWRYAEYTFIPDYTTNLDFDYLKIGMIGYGKAYVDDIIVEVIDPSEVQPTPSSDIKYSVSGGKIYIDGYQNRGAGEILIPDRIAGAPVEKISKSALVFVDKATSLTIKNGLSVIESYAFQNMTAMTKISIPKSVTSLGKHLFVGCKSLETIEVASTNQNYVSVDGVLYNADKTVLIAYPAAKAGTSFTVPSTVKEIADYAFMDAKNLESIFLPAGLESIGINAFENCSALKSIIIPEGITELKNSTFRGCESLTSVTANGVTKYGVNVFYGCKSFYTTGNFANNGVPGAVDALQMLKDLASNKKHSYVEKIIADVNNDGLVDMLDSITLQRHLAGWKGYEELPSAGLVTETADEYVTDSNKAELVINLTNTRNNFIKSGRDIVRDTNKEDITLVLIIGQSNSTTSVGYSSELAYYRTHEGKPTEAPTRPDEGTVYTGSYVKELNESNDVYYLSDVENGRNFSGYSPALGKYLSEATGTKVVFIQCASGATGMHEWTKNCEDYVCDCGENGKGLLYSNAIKNYLKTYNALSENYNIVNMGYIWNQGEHEEKYATPNATVNGEQAYYDAYLSMHNDILADLDLDFGGIVMPRAYYPYHTGSCVSGSLQDKDTVEHSRSSTVARHALYRAANDCGTLFVVDNKAEEITWESDDPSNRIHYAQNAYNKMGKQAGESIGMYLEKGGEAEFKGVTVYNWHGVVLAKFDMNGNLIEGSTTVPYTEDNKQLQIMIEPLGTHYTYDLTQSNLKGFVDDFGEVDWTALQNAGYTSFELVVNVPN